MSILKTFLSAISSIDHFFLLSESFVNIIFLQSRKQHIEKTRQLTIQTFIYYVTYFGAIIVFREIVQHQEIWFVLEYENVYFREITLFFYKHKGKLSLSSTCLRFSQFEPKIILYVMLNFKTYFMAWYCVWYEHCNGLLWVA